MRPPPSSFKPMETSLVYKDGNELRPWQISGVNWLLNNWFNRRGCILADEMVRPLFVGWPEFNPHVPPRF